MKDLNKDEYVYVDGCYIRVETLDENNLRHREAKARGRAYELLYGRVENGRVPTTCESVDFCEFSEVDYKAFDDTVVDVTAFPDDDYFSEAVDHILSLYDGASIVYKQGPLTIIESLEEYVYPFHALLNIGEECFAVSAPTRKALELKILNKIIQLSPPTVSYLKENDSTPTVGTVKYVRGWHNEVAFLVDSSEDYLDRVSLNQMKYEGNL